MFIPWMKLKTVTLLNCFNAWSFYSVAFLYVANCFTSTYYIYAGWS